MAKKMVTPVIRRKQIYLVYKPGAHEKLSDIAKRFSFGDPLKIYRHRKNWQFRALNRDPEDIKRPSKLYIPVDRKHALPPHLHTVPDMAYGNKVEFLIDGHEIFPAIIDALKSAQKNINFECYIFRNDSTGRRIAGILMEKARQGVAVNMLLDSFGSLGMAPLDQEMRDAGIKLVYAVPMNESFTFYLRRFFQSDMVARRTKWEARGLDNRDHRKLIVIDGKVAFLGGINIGDEYSGAGPGSWHDVHLKVRGPIVSALQSHFFERWITERGSLKGMDLQEHFPKIRRIPGGIMAGMVTTVPGVHRDIQHAYMRAIANAKKFIYIESAYLTSARIIRALKRARRRGVEVVVIVPTENLDVPIIEDAMELAFFGMQKKGIKVLEYSGRMCHTKAAIIDDTWATVGSANLDNRSFRRDYELNLIVWDKKFIKALKHDLFKRDIAISRPVRKPAFLFWSWVKSALYLRLYRFM